MTTKVNDFVTLFLKIAILDFVDGSGICFSQLHLVLWYIAMWILYIGVKLYQLC